MDTYAGLMTVLEDTWIDQCFYSDVETRTVMIAFIGDDGGLVVTTGCWSSNPEFEHHHAGEVAV